MSVRPIPGTPAPGAARLVDGDLRVGRRPSGRSGAHAGRRRDARVHALRAGRPRIPRTRHRRPYGRDGQGEVPRLPVVEVMPEESKNATFYQKHGFTLMADGVAMQTVNPDWRRDRYRHQQGYALIQHNNVVGGTAHRVTLQPHSSIFCQPSGTASASGACS